MEKKEEMFALVKQWQDSGQTQSEFCKASGLKKGTFSYWVSRSLGNQKKGFMPLIPQSGPIQKEVEVIYPNGVKIKIASCDLKTLAGLIRVY